MGKHDRDVLPEPAPGRQKCVDVPFLLKLIDPAERGDDASADASGHSFILHHLDILVATGLLGSDEHR